MTAIEIIKEAWQRQFEARTRMYDANNLDDQYAFARAKKMATACLRMSDNPKLYSIAPTVGEFEVEGFRVIRRKVDEVDNLYASRIAE